MARTIGIQKFAVGKQDQTALYALSNSGITYRFNRRIISQSAKNRAKLLMTSRQITLKSWTKVKGA